jgi:GNAT superfamily N-acetyltransferase
MKIFVREYAEADSISEITELLHRAYKPLADLGMRYLASYQDDGETLNRIMSGRCFLALDSTKIVGTITYYTPDINKIHWPPIYQESGVAHFGQFAIDPSYQKNGIGTMMMNHVEYFAVSEGNRVMCFDTSENAHPLIDYYTKRGYHFAVYHQWEVTNYRSVIMQKSLVLKK